MTDNTIDISQNADFRSLTGKHSTKSFYDLRSKFRRKKERLFHPIILQVASRHDIDPALVKAIIMAESGYNPNAVSKRGAKGLMQLMPSTAEALGVEDAFNPEQNISGGVRYFKLLVNRFDGDVKLALAAYNAGPQRVEGNNRIPPIEETRTFVRRVMQYLEEY